jgi:hypothetical protein
MADKGKRIASRQAQLNRRKRRGKGRTQQFDAGPGESAVNPEASADSPPSDAPQTPVTPPTGQETPETTGETKRAPTRVASNTRVSRRGRAAARAEAAAVYPYLGVELRHIGVIAAVLAVALVVLTLTLR